MARWNKVDVPHKGWKYIGIEDCRTGDSLRSPTGLDTLGGISTEF